MSRKKPARSTAGRQGVRAPADPIGSRRFWSSGGTEHKAHDASGEEAIGESLRPYQTDTIARLKAEAARRVLLVAPTGSGKTVIAGAVVAEAVRNGARVVFLAHRRELVAQASAKLHAAGVGHGIIQAGFPMRLAERVQVASIQTLHARAVRRSRIDFPPADIVIVDEAHHARARTYQRLIEAYPSAIVLGMTATPCRGDGRGLGDVFEALLECPPVAQLIADNYLVGTKVYAPTRPDLTGVRVERGDYVEKQLAGRMDRPQLVGDIVSHWLRLGERRRTVVFASSVGHSVHIRDEFRAAGVRGEHIDGRTPITERDTILAGLAAGEVDVVANCMVLTEGWDQPAVSCLVLARPTKHMGLYRQMIGRGLRPALGKVDCLVLDHAGAVFEHGFVEEPVSWTLRTDHRAANPTHKARAQQQAPALSVCPQCSAVRIGGGQCDACGWRPAPKPVVVDVAKGELGQVDRASARAFGSDEKAVFYAQLIWIAGERGYRPGWAAHQFRSRFGHWPARRVEPIEPEAATRAWVRSQHRAYAAALPGAAS